MASVIETLDQNISLSEDGSIIDITITNTGAPIPSPGLVVTAVYVDADNEVEYVRSKTVETLANGAVVTISLSIDGVTTYDEDNLHVGIGFIHSTATP